MLMLMVMMKMIMMMMMMMIMMMILKQIVVYKIVAILFNPQCVIKHRDTCRIMRLYCV